MSGQPQADPSNVNVPDDPFVWLAIHAEAYVMADRALWRFKDSVSAGVIDLSPTNEMHVETLRQARRDHYSTLVGSVMTCEAIRLGAKP